MACLIACLGGDAAAQTESIAEILVHGNRSVATAEVLGLAGLRVGDPADAERLAQAERLLRESGKFEAVEVRRRYRSIENPSEILVVLLVDERGPAVPMWLPIVEKREGHALTYGARVAFVDLFGGRTRVSAPMTWGGRRGAAIEVDHAVGATHASPVNLRASVGIQRTINPHFHRADERRQVSVGVERAIAPWLRVGGEARAAQIEFGAPAEWQQEIGARVRVDTRRDPAFPRNAIEATLMVSRWMGRVKSAPTYTPESAPTTALDATGYLGLIGPAVLAVRGQTRYAGGALPEYEWALLGGSESLRGYRAGHRAGENMAAISAELRVPVTSPLAAGKIGLRGFVDAGAAWRAGEPVRKQQYDRAAGIGLFFTAFGMAATADVGWPERGRPRLHANVSVAF